MSKESIPLGNDNKDDDYCLIHNTYIVLNT